MNTLIILCLFALSPFRPFAVSPFRCFLDRAATGTLDKVLTPELLSSVVPNRPAPVKKYLTKYGIPENQYCQYSWKGARETSLTVNGQTTVVTKPDVIALGGVRAAVPVGQRPSLPAIDLPGRTAVWDSTQSAIIVYDDTVQFTLRVDIDNDVKKNQKVAVAIVEKLACE